MEEIRILPAGIYPLKVTNTNTRTDFTPCSKVSIIDFKHVIASWASMPKDNVCDQKTGSCMFLLKQCFSPNLGGMGG